MLRSVLIGGSLLAAVLGAAVTESQVLPGEQAPLYQGVDENGHLVDMADFIDGTPMLFLYTSAT